RSRRVRHVGKVEARDTGAGGDQDRLLDFIERQRRVQRLVLVGALLDLHPQAKAARAAVEDCVEEWEVERVVDLFEFRKLDVISHVNILLRLLERSIAVSVPAPRAWRAARWAQAVGGDLPQPGRPGSGRRTARRSRSPWC